MLTIEKLKIAYDPITIVEDISFNLDKGEWKMLVGPNGAGKSTIVGAISGKIPYSGLIKLKGRDIRTIAPKDKAKAIGFLDQHQNPAYSYSVEEVVGLGRFCHRKGLFQGPCPEDLERISYALEICGLNKLRKASVLNISGGELQRTFLAQVLAQDPQILVLDEPANHLDLQYQESIFSILKDWLQDGQRSILSIVHDLSIAKAYGDSAVILANKKILAQGPINQAFTKDNLQEAYQIDVVGLMAARAKLWL